MRPSFRFPLKRSLAVSGGMIAVLGLVSWTPPNNDSVNIRSAVLDVHTSGVNDNIYSNAAAALVGSSNDIKRTGVADDLGRGFITGTSNVFSSPSGYGAVFGESNNVRARSSLVVGFDNDVARTSTSFPGPSCVYYSGIFGEANTVNGNGEANLVNGKTNTVHADQSLVAADRGWTMGYSNQVLANRGVAIGTGLVTRNVDSTALGRFNTDPGATGNSDVLVVGTGTDTTNRNDALRVTADGGVVLGSLTGTGKVVLAKAQGDISMGIYGN